ncbi:endonuclease [Bradyrhizobium canariense]|jgi:endonuclease G|uniref:DNA/RNA non-specific endonuclease n=1 Tax=Bradyrhizobium canariense TaxID=255045 RepID=UPI001CA473D3|nr:DNA/RNA non-specific endonuclease [Bradyrhizobium canariense]MBW5436456.1 endonuclease [Bradyrhizobium canariense]
MSEIDRARDRRLEVVRTAAKRWQARTQSRTSDAATIARSGPGTADSPMRQARFAVRQDLLAHAANLRERGRLPIFIERKIGPTLDLISMAPSEAARKVGRPVARIVSSVDPRVQPEGFASGFLVSPRLLLTNCHVFPDAASSHGTGANFLHEFDEHGLKVGVTFAIDASSFFVCDNHLDFALVGVSPIANTGEPIESLGAIPLSEATSKVLKGYPIEVIQYPDGGGKQYAIMNNRLLDVLDEGFLHYETDTLEGSSGSPAFSEAWELVALHHAGIPEMRGDDIVATDGSVWTEDMGEDKVHWVANEGIRISSIVQALGKVKLTDAKQAKILSDLLAGTTDPADDVSQMLRGAAPTSVFAASSGGSENNQLLTQRVAFEERSMSGTNMNFSGPVTIHVYAEQTAPPQPGAESAVAALEKTLRFDPNYEDREGYQEAFLGTDVVVPVPGIVAARSGEMYKENGEILILKYHHYSLAMNKARRLQMWSAANVDYNPDLRKQNGRAFFGTDRWVADPRIPNKFQIADPDFYKPAGQIDRGHIVRREDSAWGETAKELEFSNSDTFHWTNCTPQHQAFNRESPGSAYGGIKGLWGGFEAYIQKSLQHDDTRACIIAGPILAADDPTADFGSGPIAYPVLFWKVVAVAAKDAGSRSRLLTYGFLLSQKNVVDDFGIEFAPGQYARYQRPLAEIAELAGVTFDERLLAADAKAQAGA